MARTDDDVPEVVGSEAQRLDKWLWHARFARTRSAAARLVEEGHVRINARRETTCAKKVQAGDVLTIALGHSVRVVRALHAAPRRGPASDAQRLYEELTGSSARSTDDEVALRLPTKDVS